MPHVAVAQMLNRYLGRCGDRDIVGSCYEREIEGHFECGLVKSREYLARGDRLELRGCIRVVATHDLEQRVRFSIERALVSEIQRGRTRAYRACE